MIRLATKVDYAVTDEGKVFARELNLIGESLKSIISSVGDTRPGDDNAEAVLGAIDDVARMQIFRVSGLTIVRYVDLIANVTDPLELKDGQVISIYVTPTDPLQDSLSISGVPYSIKVKGKLASTINQKHNSIMMGIVNTTTSEINIINTGDNAQRGVLVFDEIVVVDNASYLTPVELDMDTTDELVMIEQSTIAGTPKTININTTLKEGRFLVLENLGSNEVTDTIITTQAPIKDIGTSLHLNTIEFRLKLFVENGELKSELFGTSKELTQPTLVASDITFDPSTSTLVSTEAQSAIDELDVKVNNNTTSLLDSSTRLDAVEVNQTSLTNQINQLQVNIDNFQPEPYPNVEKVVSSGHGHGGLLIDGKLYTSTVSNSLTAIGRFTSGFGEHADNVTPGFENMTEVQFPDEDFSINRIIDIGEHSYEFMYALFDNGNLYMWGRNFYGACGLGHNSVVRFPVLSATGVVKTGMGSTSNSHNIVLNKSSYLDTSGILYMSGYGVSSSLGNGVDVSVNTWTPVINITAGTIRDFWNIGSSIGALFIQLNDGSVMVNGANADGQLGIGTNVNVSAPVLASGWGVSNIVDVIGNLGDYAPSTLTVFTNATIAVLSADGTMRLCGSNHKGQLGVGTLTSSNTPVVFTQPNVSQQSPVVQISTAGSYSFAALTADGNLYIWGSNENDICGISGVTTVNAPRLLDTNVSSILSKPMKYNSDNAYTPFFWQKTNGEVWSTGWGANGQRGDGSFVSSTAPTRLMLSKGDKVKFIGSVSSDNRLKLFFAVTESNAIYTWGSATKSELYISPVSDISIPRLTGLPNTKG